MENLLELVAQPNFLVKSKRSNLTDFFNDSFFNLSLDFFNDNKLINYKTNCGENEKEFFVNLELPGFSKKDLSVNVDGKTLTVSATLEDKKEETDNKFFRKEFSKKSFTKTFEIPDNVIVEEINSKLDNGILYLSLPKDKEKIKLNRAIEIQ